MMYVRLYTFKGIWFKIGKHPKFVQIQHFPQFLGTPELGNCGLQRTHSFRKNRMKLCVLESTILSKLQDHFAKDT